MNISKKRPFAHLPFRYRLAVTLLLPAQLITSVPMSVYAAGSDSPTPTPVVPLVGTTPPVPDAPAHKAAIGSRDFKPFKPTLKFSDAHADVEITAAGVFEEALVPTPGSSNRTENAALANALIAFKARQSPEDVSALTGFLANYPNSRWAAALQLNIGLIEYQTGYLSAALTSFQLSWNLSKSETEPMAKAMADRAISEFLLLNAKVGRTEILVQTFNELKDRQFFGSAEEKVTAAKEGLSRMQNRPGMAFRCGPFAVNSILNIGKTVKGRDPIIEAARSTTLGTSIAQVKDLATKVGLDYQIAKRTPGAAFIIPAVVHWKIGHFGAIIDEKNGRYLIQDPTFGGGEQWISSKALESEGSGYYLVPSGQLPVGWQPVLDPEEAGTVWGRGGGNDRQNNEDGDDAPQDCANPPCCENGMPWASIFSSLATHHIKDTPVGYHPPVGPDMQFSPSYSYLETSQPANITFPNFGPNWSFNWLSYVTVDSSQNVTVHLRGGGTEVFPYSQMDNVNNVYSPNVLSQAVVALVSNGVYEHRYSDGSKEVFNQPDGTGRIYMTQVVDPQGNAAVIHYDANFRIDYLLDAINQKTTIAYKSDTVGNAGFYKISTITDPFLRYAKFDYDAALTELLAITDVIGMKSQFSYTGSFINSMTTPYGTTWFFFNQTADGFSNSRNLVVTFPDGSSEAVKNVIGETLTTYFWDQKVFSDYPNVDPLTTQSTRTHWCLNTAGNVQSSVVQWTKKPLEAEVDYTYTGQDSPHHMGTSNKPLTVSRAIESGTQTYQYQYGDFGQVTQTIDPAGRTFSYYFAANGIDLLEARQTKGGQNDLIGKWYYTAQHRPYYYIDASGQKTSYGYNAQGQLTSVVDPKGNTTTITYAGGYLQQIDGPLAGSSDVTNFSYDSCGRVLTVTDSEGYVLTYGYDALDRQTKVTYPDGTYAQVTYDKLDPIFSRDRLGQWTERNYDSVRHLVSETDSQGRTTSYDWCSCGSLDSIVDARGNTTSWLRDIEGRPILKTYAVGTGSISTNGYSYYPLSGLLKSSTDSISQVTNFNYNIDNSTQQINYTGNIIYPTSSVSFTYDPNYPHVASVSNTTGSITYSYTSPVTDPYGTPVTGAGQLVKVSNTAPTSIITYIYDELGRMVNRSIDGKKNATNIGYDAMNRVIGISNPLTSGTVIYNYVDSVKGTHRLSSVVFPNGKITSFNYYPNTGDQRVQEIANFGNDGVTVLSKFDYTYNPIGQITQWTQQVDANTPMAYNLGYDNANQLTSAVLNNTSSGTISKQYYYGYDASGNRTSEQINMGINKASYNAANQLIGMSGSSGPIHFQGNVTKPGTVMVNGTAATMTSGTSFVANPVLSSGTNMVSISATDGSGNTRTKNYKIVVPAGSARTFTYEGNGNLANNGTGQTYEWDAANRLIAINYPTISGTSRSEFTYDALGQRSKIIEKDITGNLNSTKQFVWCPGDSQPSEERDATNTVTKRFYSQGEQIGGNNYFYNRDHIGSIREMTDSSGIIRARYDYDPYGRLTKISGDLDSDFTYAGYYNHNASGIYGTMFRFYSADLGTWISRDPIAESGGLNLYSYCGNNVINYIDPLGLASFPMPPNWQNLPCNDLANLAQQLADVVQQRAQDLRNDKNDLYNTNPTGKNSWQGHQEAYKGAQNQLQKVIDKMNDNGCGNKVPSDATAMSQQPAPTAPDPKLSPKSSSSGFMDYVSGVTGLSGGALLTYVIISEGSRVIPFRNLVPAP